MLNNITTFTEKKWKGRKQLVYYAELFASGSRDGNVAIWDIRSSWSQANNQRCFQYVKTFLLILCIVVSNVTNIISLTVFTVPLLFLYASLNPWFFYIMLFTICILYECLSPGFIDVKSTLDRSSFEFGHGDLMKVFTKP